MQGKQNISRATIPRHAHPLVRKVFCAMYEHRITYVEMAERSGLSRETLTAWRVRNAPDLSSLEAALGVCNLRVEVVHQDGTLYQPTETTLARLGRTTEEQQLFRAFISEQRRKREAQNHRSSPLTMIGHNGGPALDAKVMAAPHGATP